MIVNDSTASNPSISITICDGYLIRGTGCIMEKQVCWLFMIWDGCGYRVRFPNHYMAAMVSVPSLYHITSSPLLSAMVFLQKHLISTLKQDSTSKSTLKSLLIKRALTVLLVLFFLYYYRESQLL